MPFAAGKGMDSKVCCESKNKIESWNENRYLRVIWVMEVVPDVRANEGSLRSGRRGEDANGVVR